jgi:hypothetical protein
MCNLMSCYRRTDGRRKQRRDKPYDNGKYQGHDKDEAHLPKGLTKARGGNASGDGDNNDRRYT